MKDTFKLYFRMIMPYRRQIMGYGAVAFFGVCLGVAGPIFMGQALDGAIDGRSLLYVLSFVAVWGGLRLAADFIRNWLGAGGDVLALRVSEGRHIEVLGKLLDKTVDYHHGTKRSELSKALGNLEGGVYSLTAGGLFDTVPNIVSSTLITGYLAFLDWRLALTLFLSLLSLVAVTWYSSVPWSLAQNDWSQDAGKPFGFGWDAINNIVAVKSSNGEDRVRAKMKEDLGASVTRFRRANLLGLRSWNLQSAVTAVGSLALLSFSLHGLTVGRITPGQVTVIVSYAFMVFGNFQWLQWQFRMLVRLNSAHRVIEEQLASPDEDYGGGKEVELSGAVEYRDVHFAYQPERPILRGVDFKVKPGERVAFVGASGEGKTTVIDLLGRYWHPQSGEVLFDGRSAADINLISLRSQMAYVSQDTTLFHESLRDNIRFGAPDADDVLVNSAVKMAALGELVAKAPEGLDTVVGERGLKLSGGERQRVGLARAFLRNPKILVLDEPTSQLDSKTEEEIQSSLNELMKGRTTFVVAHRLSTVRNADRIFVLKNGTVAEAGNHEELLSRDGIYAEMLRRQLVRDS